MLDCYKKVLKKAMYCISKKSIMAQNVKSSLQKKKAAFLFLIFLCNTIFFDYNWNLQRFFGIVIFNITILLQIEWAWIFFIFIFGESICNIIKNWITKFSLMLSTPCINGAVLSSLYSPFTEAVHCCR